MSYSPEYSPLFVTPEPSATPAGILQPSIENDSGIENDNDMGTGRAASNRSPSAMTISSTQESPIIPSTRDSLVASSTQGSSNVASTQGSPVVSSTLGSRMTFGPSLPVNDPMGYYALALRQATEEPRRGHLLERAIPSLPKPPKVAKSTPKKNSLATKSAPKKNSLQKKAIDVPLSTRRPVPFSTSPPIWSPNFPNDRSLAGNNSVNRSHVKTAQGQTRDVQTPASPGSGVKPPQSKSQVGVPLSLQEALTRSMRTAVGGDPRPPMGHGSLSMSRVEGNFEINISNPATPQSRRRPRSPSPEVGGFSPIREHSLEYEGTPSSRAPFTPGFKRTMAEDEGQDGEGNDDLYINESISSARPVKKSRTGQRFGRTQHEYGPQNTSQKDQSQHCANAVIRKEVPEAFNIPGRNRLPSRYSGAPMPWGLNQDPVMVNQNEVSNASLKKRGLKRGDGDKVCKRSYGANDPENIRIVNLKENDDLSFAQIAQILNEKRIEEGKPPSMTACGVTARYNRTAPLLFAAEGKVFVPLSERRRNGASRGQISLPGQSSSPSQGSTPGQGIPRRGQGVPHGSHTGKPAWNDEYDELLVDKVKEYEAGKWSTIADMMQEETGLMFDAQSVASRHTML